MAGPGSTLAARLLRRVERLLMGRRAYKWVLRDWLSLGDLRAAAELLGTMRFTRQIEPQLMPGPAATDILVLAPHPDDEVIGPGGTLIRAVRAGKKVTILFITSGTDQEASLRENEALACCAANGFEPHFLKGIAGQIPLEPTARAVADFIRKVKPGAIFLPFVLDDHDDHRRTNEVLLEAISANQSVDSEIWAYQVYTPLPGNIVVDVTDLIDAKSASIRTYQSQMRRRDWSHFARGLNAFNCRFLPGRHDSCYAECFFVVPGRDYHDICRRYFASGAAYYEPAYARK